jgi:hypothetical protein
MHTCKRCCKAMKNASNTNAFEAHTDKICAYSAASLRHGYRANYHGALVSP